MGTNRVQVWRVVLVTVVAAASAVALWDSHIAPNLFPKRLGTVVEGQIYRSGRLTPAAMRRVVERYGVRTVIDLGADPEGSPADRRSARVAEALGLQRYRLHLSGDATGDPDEYLQALRLMTDPSRQPVLVHCGAGSERTGCAVALYRYAVEGVPLSTAYEEAQRFDHDPRRNPHLWEMLERWAEPISAAYRSGGSMAGPADGSR